MLIYLFIPLMIIRSKLNESWVGYFLFAVAVPLIIFEYYFAKKANTAGFRKMFKIGYLSVAIISAVCFFISNIYLVLLLISLASIGMAMLEPTTEAYFFDMIKSSDKDRFYGPYETSLDVGGFVAKMCASTLLIFLPSKFLFILFATFMFVLFLVSFKAKDLVESK
jgi:MFS family permease